MRLIIFVIVLIAFFFSLLFYLNPEPVTFKYFFARELRISLPFLLGLTFIAGVVFSLFVYSIRVGFQGIKEAIAGRKKKKEDKILKKAELLIEEGEYEKALNVLKGVENSSQKAFFEGLAYFRKGAFGEAFEAIKKKIDFENIFTVNLAMEAGMRSGRWEEVKFIGNKALEVYGSSPAILKKMVYVCENTGDIKDAIEFQNKYVKKNGTEKERKYLAFLYYLQGKKEQDAKNALKMFKTSLEVSPCFSPSLVELIKIYLKEGAPEKGLKKVKECMRNKVSYYLLMEVPHLLIDKGYPSQALEFVEEFKNENDAGATFAYLKVLYDLGMREELKKELSSLSDELQEKISFKFIKENHPLPEVEELYLWVCEVCERREKKFQIKCPCCGNVDVYTLSLP